MSILEVMLHSEAPDPGSMNIDIVLRTAVSEAIRKTSKDRFFLCAEISRLTGVEVSKHSLDAWSAESRAKSGDHLDFNGNKRWGIPAELIPAFCQATCDWKALHIIVEAANFKALKGHDVVRSEIDELDEKIKRYQAKKERLLQALGEVDQ